MLERHLQAFLGTLYGRRTKLNARLIVSGIVRDSIEGLRMNYPKTPRAAPRNCRACASN